MAADGIEHETEIRSEGGRLLAWVGVAVLVGVAALLALRSGGAAPERVGPPPVTPTSETLTTVEPPSAPDVYGVADAQGGPVPAVATDAGDVASPFVDGGFGFESLQATPIATGDRVVVLVDDGRLLAGSPGRAFVPIFLGPVSTVVPSNEPGHVWARVAPEELALIDVDGGGPSERIAVGTDRVLGPASFGVVTVTETGEVRWRRPRFDPTPVPLPSDRVAIDAGGEVVLVDAPQPSGGRHLEAYGVTDGALRQVFRLPSGTGVPKLAPDGSHVIAPTPSHWTVREVASGLDAGRLPMDVRPVWVGGRRFAATVGGDVWVSDGRTIDPSWRVRALAEQSPAPRR